MTFVRCMKGCGSAHLSQKAGGRSAACWCPFQGRQAISATPCPLVHAILHMAVLTYVHVSIAKLFLYEPLDRIWQHRHLRFSSQQIEATVIIASHGHIASVKDNQRVANRKKKEKREGGKKWKKRTAKISSNLEQWRISPS